MLRNGRLNFQLQTISPKPIRKLKDVTKTADIIQSNSDDIPFIDDNVTEQGINKETKDHKEVKETQMDTDSPSKAEFTAVDLK